MDILVERHDGGLIAVQAKCLRPDKNLVLDDLKQFWLKVKGNRKLAANRIVTTGEWGRTGRPTQTMLAVRSSTSRASGA